MDAELFLSTPQRSDQPSKRVRLDMGPDTCDFVEESDIPLTEGETRETSADWSIQGESVSAEQIVAAEGMQVCPLPDKSETCSVCMDDFSSESDGICLKLKSCHSDHYFHQPCITNALRAHPRCPNCLVNFGLPKGTQPRGKMTIVRHQAALPGERSAGMFIIIYQFPNGIQGPEHPNPGQPYHGTSRRAFLPASEEGCQVLRKFMRAWDARLLFTIGTSVTTGQQNAVIWNGIHHKTNVSGGPCQFGFPDATYLKRVTQELAAAGIM